LCDVHEIHRISWKIAAPEKVISGLLAPLARAGRDEPGIVVTIME
jgi:hypothetical protein